jgi:hypothetical protein
MVNEVKSSEYFCFDNGWLNKTKRYVNALCLHDLNNHLYCEGYCQFVRARTHPSLSLFIHFSIVAFKSLCFEPIYQLCAMSIKETVDFKKWCSSAMSSPPRRRPMDRRYSWHCIFCNSERSAPAPALSPFQLYLKNSPWTSFPSDPFYSVIVGAFVLDQVLLLVCHTCLGAAASRPSVLHSDSFHPSSRQCRDCLGSSLVTEYHPHYIICLKCYWLHQSRPHFSYLYLGLQTLLSYPMDRRHRSEVRLSSPLVLADYWVWQRQSFVCLCTWSTIISMAPSPKVCKLVFYS